jgi:aspartokinase-like uncharacterized kinase
MKILRIKNPESLRFPEDVARISKILLEKGYMATSDQCEYLWEIYSDSLCAGWLILPEDDEYVLNCIEPWIASD